MADPQTRQRRRRRRPSSASASLEEHRLVTVGDAGAFAKRDKHTELKVELHQRLLDLINLQALDKMSRAADRGRGRRHRRRGARQAKPRAQPGRAQAAGRRRPRRAAGPRAARAAAQGPDDHRHPGQRPRPACSSSATACSSRARFGSRTSGICFGSSRRSCRRSAAGSMNLRRWSMPVSPTAAASTRSSRRSRSTARCSRSANSRGCRSAWSG